MSTTTKEERAFAAAAVTLHGIDLRGSVAIKAESMMNNLISFASATQQMVQLEDEITMEIWKSRRRHGRR